MIEQYLRELGDELRRRGVGGRDRGRVLAETEDHLRELAAEHGEAGSISRFGESAPLAWDIAAQLATTRTIRTTYCAFATLAVSGIGYFAFVAFIDHGGWPDIFAGDQAAIGVLAAIGLAVFPQIAFVAGGLALLRALRRRGRGVLSCEELDVMRRRSAVALGACGMTLASMSVWALEFRDLGPILALSLVVAVPLGLVSIAVVQASGTQAVSEGPPEDVFDDLHLEGLRPHPWRFALLVALVVAVPPFVTNGPILAAVEILAVLGGFALLGRPLALRR